MTNPVSTSDIADRWRPLSAPEIVNAEAFLRDAWALLTARRPLLDEDMASGAVATENVVRVVCSMVLRVLKNPDGWEQETIDDWTGRRNALIASGVLHVTDDELADVSPGRRTRRSARLVVYGDA